MPIFRNENSHSLEWCELKFFEILRLSHGESHIFPRTGQKEKLFIGVGCCQVTFDKEEIEAAEGQVLSLDFPTGRFEVKEALMDSTLVRSGGDWGEEIGNCGVFTLNNSSNPKNIGDPVEYPRTTEFDNHYHDCDEYWIIFDGKGIAVSEGRFYPLTAGDCLATRRGHHHDFPQVIDPIKGVYLETTLRGKKRLGHLWDHTHGIPTVEPY